uniref:Ig-like domain-containing protein n=1 Tax=Trichuris muris TaxID=70415 RepID=A0A5S6QTA4_TRIMR
MRASGAPLLAGAKVRRPWWPPSGRRPAPPAFSGNSHAPIDRAHKALNRPLFSRRRRGKFSSSPIDSRLGASSILGCRSVGKLERVRFTWRRRRDRCREGKADAKSSNPSFLVPQRVHNIYRPPPPAVSSTLFADPNRRPARCRDLDHRTAFCLPLQPEPNGWAPRRAMRAAASRSSAIVGARLRFASITVTPDRAACRRESRLAHC